VHAPRLPLQLIALVAALACLPVAAQVVTTTIGVGIDPASAAVDTTRNKIYVANYCGSDPTCTLGGGSVSVINGATLGIQTVTVGAYPYNVAVDTGLDQIYTATCASDPNCASLGAVTEINGGSLATQNIAATGYLTHWVVVNPVTHYLYAVNECNDPNFPNCTTLGTVTVINGNNLTAEPVNINVGAFPYSAAVNPSTNMIYVMNRCGTDLTCSSLGTVTVINGNTNKVTATITVAYYPQLAAVDQVHNLIYVANNGGLPNGSVSVINGATNMVETTITVGKDPSPVVFNPNTNTIYVGNRCSEPTCIQPPSVSVINGNTLAVTATVSICRMENYPADDSEIDLTTNKIYFACEGRSAQDTTGLSLTVLDGATNTVTPVAVGDYPNAAAVNSATNQIYVPNQGDDTVSIIGGSTKLQLVNVTPCRVVDTRQATGEFGGPPITGGTSRSFPLPQNTNCNIPSSAAAYSLNVTVVPKHPLGYLTIWPTPEYQPTVSTLNSTDGRVKANAAMVPAGVGGAVSVYASNTTNVILDIDGYYAPATSQNYQFFKLPPCRLVDTRGAQAN
jgi:YVTN family beta-propeller protein